MPLIETNKDFEFSARVLQLSNNIEKAAVAIEALTKERRVDVVEIGKTAIHNYNDATQSFRTAFAMSLDTAITAGDYEIETPQQPVVISLKQNTDGFELFREWTAYIEEHPLDDLHVSNIRLKKGAA